MCDRTLVDRLILPLVAAGSAIAGGLVTGFYEHWRDWYERPKLQLDYEGTDGNRIEADRTEAGHLISEIYIRARVRNTGRRAAKDCVVFLTAITEVHPGGKTTPTPYHDAMPLGWPGWKFSPRDIPRGVEFYVDVMKVSKNSPGWMISVERLFTDRLRDYSGTYRFQLTAIADNALPVVFEIDVTYNQDWHNLRAVAW
jgi:hypothetical protein